ncbi:hypothetical protein [Fulvivirga lutea]|uniref:Uncharacterized protein n=1 Tax=Fulvivirga lutea TaxID=2810512 RepID=A0A974WHZ8_9BACT|nr:hypothetical protein [Fulvivirga lutea]QSE98761.1 hypothetical protein JR347_06685 [Fulvivirga lutea]
MDCIYLISKNIHLAEFLSEEGYECVWFNDQPCELHSVEFYTSIVVYDTLSYGYNIPQLLKNHARGLIILSDYLSDFYLKNFTEENQAILLIHNFIHELNDAIASVLSRKNYQSKKLKTKLTAI